MAGQLTAIPVRERKENPKVHPSSRRKRFAWDSFSQMAFHRRRENPEEVREEAGKPPPRHEA